MNRDAMMLQISDSSILWDVAVIGGGATGLGVAVEAAARGYRTVLLEQGDFAQGTSSRSTKLIHGGVRYLQQGNISLVLEALHERGLLLRNAPHLVRHQAFIVPNYEWWEGPFYGIGLKFYDMLAGKLGLGPSRHLTREETLERIPTLEPKGLRGGIIYYDGQFDDARLAIMLARTLVDLGGCGANYVRVTGLLKKEGMVRGVTAVDGETGATYDISARVVVNATGIFVDDIRKMDLPDTGLLVSPSQGIHIVLDRYFLPGDSAIMVPHTDDGRVLFAVPWQDVVIVGTTDTAISKPTLSPRAFPEEIDFLLSHAARYLSKDPAAEDVRSVFAGIRPLIENTGREKTAVISREHQVLVSRTGLVTIAGGKWTTYRKMGQDAVDMAATIGRLEQRPSRTETLRLHGWTDTPGKNSPYVSYGTDAVALMTLSRSLPELEEGIHPNLPYRYIEVLWAIRYEMARTLADVLSRRLRALILDARAAMAAAPKVAAFMARELGWDKEFEAEQVTSFCELAAVYLITDATD
ncbi:MAG: glycerol-3-phosphate dehydrogenase/oxidase [Desulfobacterales bacterium]|jgi:glycerol-3-phosphate dehydrogenase|nr:glycerol-3-phosphate dehydrogenase/oxidase [Desulfobacterales bacterium]